MLSCPLLSIIIPTFNRPQFLPRAIGSALQAAPNGDVEVIVVPNGSDIYWQTIAEIFKDEPRVKWHPIEKAHANAARNHGMKLAQGEYIRFLDDDDFFHTIEVLEQLDNISKNGNSVSYGYIEKVTPEKIRISSHSSSQSDDFCSFIMFPSSSTPIHGFLYKRSILKNLSWDENVVKRDDLYWLFDIAFEQDLKIDLYPKHIGAWVEHSGQRLSKGHSVNQTSKETAKRALNVYFQLKNQKRLNEEREMAISSRLWRCVHDGLMFEPLYWIKIAFIARRISKNGNPATPIYQILPYWLTPLILELLLVPIRWGKTLFGHRYQN